MNGNAVQIVQFDDHLVRATLNDRAVKEVIEARPEILDLPTVVVSIGGVTRSGKSFLLNLLVNYFRYSEKVGNAIKLIELNDCIAKLMKLLSKMSE